jgi:hypothetical protein
VSEGLRRDAEFAVHNVACHEFGGARTQLWLLEIQGDAVAVGAQRVQANDVIASIWWAEAELFMKLA